MEDQQRRVTVFLACFALPLIVVMTVQGFISRANANWAAPAYVAGTVWVVAALIKRQFWLRVSLGLHVLVALIIVNYDALANVAGIELTKKTDPMKRLRGWDHIASALGSTVPPVVGDDAPIFVFDERKVLTPMLYYMPEVSVQGIPRPDFAKWNPDGHIDDHYELTADLKNYAGRNAYFVTRWPSPEIYEKAFSGPMGSPTVITVPIHKDYSQKVYVIPVGRFIGYPQTFGQ